MHDVIIAGGGPAGLNAALYAARAGLDVVLLEKMFAGGQMVKTTNIDNYIGFPQGIGAVELAMNMEEQAKGAGVKIIYEEITELKLSGKVKRIITSKQEYESKTAILCMGAEPRMLGVEGEERLRGFGVSYCATCDGAFFKNKTVAVVGGGDTALEDALFLSHYCEKIYLVHRRDRFRGAKILADKVAACDNVELLLDSVVEKIVGEEMVCGLCVRNLNSDTVTELAAEGVFIAVGMKPNSGQLGEQLRLYDGYIDAGEDTKTSCPGVFAAGDIRRKPLRQVITAAADGAVAAYAATKYIDTEF